MLASMSEIDPRADAPLVDWSDLGVSGLLPTGTVTLLLADVEGSMRLWETQPEQMTTAIARLNQVVCDVIAAHDGVRPVEQGEGDSFVAAFARASDAVAAALELQRAPLAPIRLRIGVHTGEVQLRDESNYAGPAINRTARLRDLAHGGQTVLSGATEAMVARSTPRGCVADRSGHAPAARSAPPGAGGAAVPPRPYKRVPAAAHTESPCGNKSSGAADQFRGPRGGADPGAGAAGPKPGGDVDRRGWGGQNPTGDPGRGPDGRPVRRRGVVCGSGADHRPRAGARDRGACAGAARPTRPTAYIFDLNCRCRSAVPGCFLNELHPRGQPEFGVDVGEVGLHGPR